MLTPIVCRALFGNVGGECITTLAAWTVMCEEARSFGRSLYDAEQVLVFDTHLILTISSSCTRQG